MGTSPSPSIIENIEPDVVILYNKLSVSHINRMFLLNVQPCHTGAALPGKRACPARRRGPRQNGRNALPDQEIEAPGAPFLKVFRHDRRKCYFPIKLVPLTEKRLTAIDGAKAEKERKT